MKLLSIKVLTVLVLVLCGANVSYAATVLHYDSSPESRDGQGQSVTLTPEDGFIFWPYTDAVAPPYDTFWVLDTVVYDNTSTLWKLALHAPNGSNLGVGRYDNCGKPYFTSGPGLAFYKGLLGEYFDTLGGWFDIKELSVTSSGEIDHFAVDFTQYEENMSDRWIAGQLRYNSDIPIVPEPTSLLLLGSGLLGLAGLRKRK